MYSCNPSTVFYYGISDCEGTSLKRTKDNIQVVKRCVEGKQLDHDMVKRTLQNKVGKVQIPCNKL